MPSMVSMIRDLLDLTVTLREIDELITRELIATEHRLYALEDRVTALEQRLTIVETQNAVIGPRVKALEQWREDHNDA